MKKENVLLKTISVFVIFGLTIAAYLLAIRPWQLTWGATDEEITRFMPGDELLEQSDFNATRAVTVNASPEEIWPWIIQMGHHQAGFYAYDWFDNGFVPSSEKILPEFQDLEIGGDVTISSLVVHKVWEMKAYETIVWVGGGNEIDGAWTWGLYPLENGQTRFVTRLRGDYDWSSPFILMNLWIDWGDFPFMRKSMLGIKQRAEGNITDTFLKANLEGVLWFGCLFMFIVAIIQIFKRDEWFRPWIIAFATAITFLSIFYARIPLWIGGVFETGIYLSLFLWREK